MLNEYYNLQRFAEGEGGEAPAESSTENEGMGENEFGIPDRAKDLFKKSQAKIKPVKEQTKTEEEKPKAEEKAEKLSYADMIKSDDYKEEHRQYMEKAIGERLKKYKGLDETVNKQKELLDKVSVKYGIDINDDAFLDHLGKAIDDDDSYYEKYAQENDLSPQEARKIVTLQRQVAENDRKREAERIQAENNQRIAVLQQNAERTRAIYPGFNLEAEMQNPNFLKIVASTNGDTTAAYRVTHWNELQNQMIRTVTEQATQNTVNAVKQNQARPSEVGLSSQASTNTVVDFRNMNLEQIRAYADAQRRKRG